MAKPNVKDMHTEMKEIKERAAEVKLRFTKRNEYIETYNEMYHMELNIDIPQGADLIVSPDARNQVLGAARMMFATDPIINMRAPEEGKKLTKVENFIKIALEMSGKITGVPLHHELILSAMLYAEMHTGITLTADLLARAKATGKGVKRMERLAAMTPWIFVPYQPGTGYPEMGTYGMTGYYREVETTIRRLKEDFSDLPESLVGKKGSDKVTLSVWFDDDRKAVWVGGEDISIEYPDWPCFPVCVQLTDGSYLFDKEEEQRAPLLYTLMKSKLWEQETAALTAMYHFTKSMSAVPLFVHKSNSSAKEKLKIEYSKDRPYGVVELAQGEEFDIVHNKGTIDPNLMESYQTARRLVEESTIYKAALGAPPEQASTFSELSLLATSGRAPLINPQKRGGWGISNILETAMLLSKDLNQEIKTFGMTLPASEIPALPMVDVILDIQMPEDSLQNASIVSTLTKAGVVSKEWLQEKILHITDTEGMTKQIWFEAFLDTMVSAFMQEQMQPDPGMLPEDVPMPEDMPGGPGGMPMDAGPGMVNPDMEGLPPAMGGMVRGAGQGMAPEQGPMIPGGQ